MRNIIFYEDHFTDFYFKQPEKVQRKIDYVLDLVRNVDRVPEKFLKHLTNTDGIYEIRVSVGNNIYRILCFWDDGDVVVLVNSFQKKTQKTPKGQINKAERLKAEYFAEKKNQENQT